MCSGPHGIWQCEKFRLLSLTERKKVVTEKSLCFKCLAVGHYARMCLKKHFRCQSTGCGKEHHTLLHPVEVTEVEKKGKDIPQRSGGAGQQPSNGEISGEDKWNCSGIYGWDNSG